MTISRFSLHELIFFLSTHAILLFIRFSSRNIFLLSTFSFYFLFFRTFDLHFLLKIFPVSFHFLPYVIHFSVFSFYSVLLSLLSFFFTLLNILPSVLTAIFNFYFIFHFLSFILSYNFISFFLYIVQNFFFFSLS